ncbi:M48 family metalloprotease [Streptomyces rishiriensis]|uniref:M48 family metalloprotease n=1 Tax=Streptomyces rishiriensis TaxID=68264 RepID=UPI0037AE7EC6
MNALMSDGSEDHGPPGRVRGRDQDRQWLLGLLMLGLGALPEAVFLGGLLAVCLLWGSSWSALGPLAVTVVWTATAVAGRGPLPGRAVRPQEEPELAALVRDVADRLDFRERLLVRVVPDVDASLCRVRVSGVRTHVLLLGLPLLRALTEAQLASVIAHELAHRRHVADRRLNLLIGARGRLGDRLDSRFRPLAPVAGPLLRASQAVLWHTETAADADAARIAGTEATAGALRRTALVHAVFEGLGDAWLAALAVEDAYPVDLYDALDAALADPHVTARAARAAAEEDLLDPYARAGHPPVALRVAALPRHTGAPYGRTPLTLRTGPDVERWCVRETVHLDEVDGGGEPTPVRLLDMTPDRLRELGGDTGPLRLRLATGLDSPAAMTAAALDTVADGSWPRLARRLEPSLRWAPAAARGPAARQVFTTAVGRTLVQALRSDGWTPASRWIDTALTAPDDGRVVDVHRMVGQALDDGDPAPLRALTATAGQKENAV